MFGSFSSSPSFRIRMDIAGNLTDEFQELNLDRPAKAAKSLEEIEKLTVDEKLTDIERAVYLLSAGQEVQRVSVITALPNLLKDNNAECMRRVVPKVREVLYVAQQDMQLAASTAFLQILQDKLVPLQNYTQTFLQTILTSVDSKDAEVSAAWLGTLLDVIELLPSDVVKKDILGIAINKGQLQQPVSVRLSCCKILGKIATKFESFLIKKEILPVVQQLCQDVEHEVRACMCNQLHLVAKGLGIENTKSAILPELVELTNDEESNVRITGLDTVVNMLPMMDHDTLGMIITPLVCKFCHKAMQAEDDTLPVVAKQFGRLCHGLQSVLTEDQKSWFLDYYRKLCKVGLPDKKDKSAGSILEEDEHKVKTRSNAAFNFPAMVIFVTNKNFKADLASTLTALCKDPCQQVRKTIACGFHEVCKLLGQHVVCIFPDLVNLLKDENIEVLEGIVGSLPTCLEFVLKSASAISEAKASTTMDVVQSFLATEAVVFSSNSWRLQEDMMRNMSFLGKICSQDLLYSKVVPILLAKMKHGRALPVRHAAARSLLVLMRSLYKQEQRDQLLSTLIADFCHGKSCHSRGLFIVICKYIIELYSKAFFKEHFFEFVLALTSDRVPNIRLRTCALLPSLKRMIKLPYDNALKGSLEQCVRKVLVNERDRDVIEAMKQAVDELDQIHVQMESMVSRRKNFEDDEDDQVKEDEEKQLLQMEEKERKEDEMRKDKKSTIKKDASKLPSLKKVSINRTPSVTNSKSDIRKPTASGGSIATSSAVQPAFTVGSSSSDSYVNKMKDSPMPQRTGINNLSPSAGERTSGRKGSVGSLPSVTTEQRGSLSSASSTRSEPATRTKKTSQGPVSGSTSNPLSPAKPARKISKP